MAWNYAEALRRAKKRDEEETQTTRTPYQQQQAVSQQMAARKTTPTPITPVTQVKTTSMPTPSLKTMGVGGVSPVKTPVPTAKISGWQDVLDAYNISLPAVGGAYASSLPLARRQELAAQTQQAFADRPMFMGALQGFSLSNPLTELQNKLNVPIDVSATQATLPYKAGNIIGMAGQFGLGYGTLGGAAVEGTTKLLPKALPKLAEVGTKGITGASQALSKVIPKVPQIGEQTASRIGQGMAESLAKDIAIGLPLNVNIALAKEQLTGKDALKNIAANTALDIGLGGVFETIGGLVLKNGTRVASASDFDALTPSQKQEAILMLPEPTAYTTPQGTTSFDINASAVKTEDELFNEWRKENFGGAFGRVSDEDMKALRELYNETKVPDYSAAAGQIETPFRVTPGEIQGRTMPQSLTQSQAVTESTFPTRVSAAAAVEPTLPAAAIPETSMPTRAATTEPTLPTMAAEATARSDQALGVVPEGMMETIGETKGAARRLYTSLVSGQESIERFAKAQEQSSMTAKELTQSVRTSKGTTNHIFQKGLVDRYGTKISDKSYKSLIESIPEKELADFNTYKQNLHNIARWEQGKPVFTQTAPEESQRIVNELLERHPQFEQYSDDISKWWNDFAEEWLVKSGRLSQEQWDAMRKMYPDYIPTYRVDKGMRGTGGSYGNVINAPRATRGATGGTSEVIPLQDSFLTQISRIVSGTRKNDLYLNLIKDIQANPAKFNTFGRMAETPKTDLTGDLTGVLDSVDLKNFEEVQQGIFRLTAYEGGQPISAYINKDLKDALTLLDDPIGSEYMRAFTEAGKKVTTPVKTLTTGINPFFVVANMSRDFPAYLINSEANILKATSSFGRALKELLTGGEMARQYKALGGGQAGFYTQGKGFNETLRYQKSLPARAGSAAVKPFEVLGEVTESIPRMAEYINLIDKYGDTPTGRLKALQGSADVTVNFSRSAPITKTLDGWVLYLNAAMQGLDKFARTVKAHPVRTAERSAAIITAPMVGLYMVNKDNPNYQDLDDRTKQNYYVIPNASDVDENGYAKTFFKIPLTREYGVIFGSSLDVIADMIEGKENPMEGYKESVATSFAPPTEGFFAPITTNLPYNKDFAGRPIVPMGMENLSPEYQRDYRTSGIAQGISNVASNLGVPSETLRSPMKVDYLLGAYGGGLAQAAKGFTSQQNQDVGDRLKRATVEPMQRRFTADPLYSSGVVTDFYNQKETIEKAVADEKYGEGVPGEYKTPNDKALSVYTQASKQMTELRKEERALLISGKSKDEIKKRSEEIRTEINEIARNAKSEASEVKTEYEKTYIAEISDMSDYRQEIYRNELQGKVKPEVYKEIIQSADVDGNDSISQKEAREVLDKSNLTTPQKAAIWKAMNKSWKNNPYQ